MTKSYFGRALLFFEILWGILWVASLFLFHFMDNTDFMFRTAFFFTAFHFLNPPFTYENLRRFEEGKQGLRWSFILFGITLATDLNSLLETVLHLKNEGKPTLYGLMLGITVSAITLSVLTYAWFLQRYYYGSSTEKIRNPPIRFTWSGKNPSP